MICSKVNVLGLIISLLLGLCAFVSPIHQPKNSPETDALLLVFTNQVGTKPLVLTDKTYTNATGEVYTMTTFNYFISNIVLTRTDGTDVPVPNQYFLIRQADPASQRITLTGLPTADYQTVKFVIGVDSLKSTSSVSARTGALDPAGYGTDNMYWTWNSGYVFVKFEGTSPVAPARADGARLVQWHVGGFGGGVNGAARTRNNLRTISLALPKPARVRQRHTPEVQLIADLATLIDHTTHLSFATLSTVHGPGLAGPIADNYQAMFRVDRVRDDLK